MRPDYRARGYSPEWDRISAEFKQTHPFCLSCWMVGIVQPVEIVDHIVPVTSNKARLLDPTNLQAACKWCHDCVKRPLELDWRLGRLPLLALRLDSAYAVKLMHDRYPVPVGLDGYRLFELGKPRGPYPTFASGYTVDDDDI
jgi:5-methylcytosine-specific restriction protein A